MSDVPPSSQRPGGDEPFSPEAGRPSLVQRFEQVIAGRAEARPLLLSVLFTFAVFWVLAVAKEVFLPLTFALLLYFLLRPVVRGLAKAFIPAAISSALILVILGGSLAIGGVALGGPASHWVERAPTIAFQLERKLRPLRRPVERVSQFAERVERAAKVDQTRSVREVAIDKPGLLGIVVSGFFAFLAQALIAFIALYFMLIYGDRLVERLLAYLQHRQSAAKVMRSIESRMSRYLFTITVINTLLGLGIGTGLALLGMPNPWLWGAMAGLFNFVPYLGAVAGMLVVLVASIVSFPTLSQAMLPPLLYLGFTTLEGQVITPAILGRTFQMSPLVIFIWIVFWAWLWGVAGALIAVPLLMLLKLTSEQSPALAPLSDLLRR